MTMPDRQPVNERRSWVRETARGVAGAALLAIWNKVQPAEPHPWMPSISPTDNLQRTMNLIMPLRRRFVIRKGELLTDLVKSTDMIYAGLNNVGTIHSARFDLIGNNLCMLSVYDGELSGYIRDFIGVIGQAFDVLMGYVADPPRLPTSEHADEFIAWVAAHDAFQFPDEATDLCPKLNALEREGLLMLRRHRHVQLGAYRGYPGYSVAQVRQGLGIGW